MTDTLETPAKPKQKRAAHKRPRFQVGDHNDEWANNAELIADAMALYAKPGMVIADVTYGLGKFWPLTILPFGATLIRHDIDEIKGDGVSFLDLPEEDGTVDILVLDPEYVSRGGRETSTLDRGETPGQGMIARYGQDHAPRTPEALWTVIQTGMEEAHRVLKPGGLLWLKCMNYISSATLQPYVKWALDAFDDTGYDLEDWATLTGHPGPQPSVNLNGTPRLQFHMRQNASHLLIGRKRRD